MASKSLRHKSYPQAEVIKERARLLGWPKILTFTLLIIAVMTLLFPRSELIEQVTHTEKPDSLSRLYLQNLLKNEPSNPQLLMKRLDELIKANRLVEADQLIPTLKHQNDPAIRLQLAQLTLLLRERQAFAYPPASAQRQQALPALQAALANLSEFPLSLQQREQLASKAMAYGANALAIQIYQGLATSADSRTRFQWIEKSAQAALATGRYQEAADIYLNARHLQADLAWQKKMFLGGVAALRASGRPAEALDRAENELGELSSEPDILIVMVRLAQSANRNDRAEIYVRKLLRFAELGISNATGMQLASTQQLEPQEIRSDALALSNQIADCKENSAPFATQCWQRMQGKRPSRAHFDMQRIALEPKLPFDDQIYRLGYEVFLANKNLASAYSVAYAAVKQSPGNGPWRERLALVAEWNGQPAHALEQWQYLALNQGSEKAWQAILRLAPGLFDEQSVILALMHEYTAGRLNDERLLRLVQAFEATGEARKGVEFLDKSYQKTSRPIMLEQQAWLEERLGQYNDAISTIRRLGRNHGTTPAYTRRLATLLIAQGYTTEAYRTLQQQDNQASRRDSAYQALMAELAWNLQDRRNAMQIYQTLQGQRPLEDYEAERLILLMRGESQTTAARLAARLWDQHHNPRYLHLALESYILARDIPAAQALLASLTSNELETMSKQVDFLLLRAEVHRQANELPEAIQLMQRARLIQPENNGLTAQLIWTLVEARDRDQLAPLLNSLRTRAMSEPTFWGAMGAGYMVLSRPREALPYYARQVATRQDDYLWQIDYAHVLEEAGRADMAWRVRRYAWLNLRRAGKPDSDQMDTWRGMVSLALRMAPGDVSAQWLREWLRLDNPGQTQRSPEAKELAIAWYLSNEKFESARLWLTQQYGQQLQAPGWAEAALALQNNDKDALKRIAEGEGENIAPETRTEAALQLRNYEAARKLAAAGLDVDPDNNVLHLQLTDSVWQQQNRVGGGYRREELGALRRQGWHAGVQWSVRPALKMGLTLSEDTLSSLDTNRLNNLPGKDQKITFFGKLEHALGETVLKLFYRKAQDSQPGVEVSHELKLDRRLSINASAGYNLEANENDVLSAAGSKDTIKLGAQWLISKRDYLIADLSTNTYHGQDRTYLGKSTGLAIQMGHHLRVEYPDLTVKLLGSVYKFDEDGQAGGAIRTLLPPGATLLPGSFNQYGAGFSIGESINEQFSRAFRPYATFDFLHSSGAGWGYGMELGFVVSPTGKDWLRGRYRTGQNTFGGNQDASLLDLEYRYLF